MEQKKDRKHQILEEIAQQEETYYQPQLLQSHWKIFFWNKTKNIQANSNSENRLLKS